MGELTYAALADKYRNQRDVLREAMEGIVKDDAEGKGYFAKLAKIALAKAEATDETGTRIAHAIEAHSF